MFHLNSIFKKTWVRVAGAILLVLFISVASLATYAYFKISQLKNTLRTCELNQKDFLTEIDFDYSSGLIVVQAKINGSSQSFPFILDTGAVTVISQRLIDELAIETTTMAGMKVSNGAAIKPEFLTLDKLELGEVTFNQVGALVMDGDKLGRLNCISPYGIIGCNVLQSAVFQMDYQNKRLTMTDSIQNLSHVQNAHKLSYQTRLQETPELTIKIDKHQKEVLLLDTGHSGFITIHSSKIFEEHKNFDISRSSTFQCQHSITIHGDQDVKSMVSKFHYQTNLLEMGPIKLSNLVIDLTVDEERSKNGTNGVIGNRFLEKFTMTLDYKKHAVYLDPLPDGHFSRKKSILGLRYNAKDNGMYVHSIYDNSEAALAGIKVGDHILSINGLDVSFIPDEDICQIYLGEKTFVKKDDDTISLQIMCNGQKKHCVFSRFIPMEII